MTVEAKVGWIPSSPDLRIASARLRAFLPSRYLREAGWDSELFDERRAAEYDVVVFQKVYDEPSIALADALGRGGAITVFDLCDNHFYNPDGRPELAERAERLRRMLDVVHAVSVATPALAELVAEREPPVIDDALDELRIPLIGRLRRRVVRSSAPLRLVWYGNAGLESPSFGLTHLPKLLPVLERLHAAQRVSLTVISNSHAAFERVVGDVGFPAQYVEWSLASFARVFCAHDVCVIPVEVNPFTVCKTANRVALSLRLGVPVVADRIPSFDEFAPFVRLGEWAEALERYASDPDMRARDASRGRAYVAARYTPERVVSEWSEFLARLLGERGSRRPGPADALAGNAPAVPTE